MVVVTHGTDEQDRSPVGLKHDVDKLQRSEPLALAIPPKTEVFEEKVLSADRRSTFSSGDKAKGKDVKSEKEKEKLKERERFKEGERKFSLHDKSLEDRLSETLAKKGEPIGFPFAGIESPPIHETPDSPDSSYSNPFRQSEVIKSLQLGQVLDSDGDHPPPSFLVKKSDPAGVDTSKSGNVKVPLRQLDSIDSIESQKIYETTLLLVTESGACGFLQYVDQPELGPKNVKSLKSRQTSTTWRRRGTIFGGKNQKYPETKSPKSPPDLRLPKSPDLREKRKGTTRGNSNVPELRTDNGGGAYQLSFSNDALVISYLAFVSELTPIQKAIFLISDEPTPSNIKFAVMKLIENITFGDALPKGASLLIKHFVMAVAVDDTIGTTGPAAVPPLLTRGDAKGNRSSKDGHHIFYRRDDVSNMSQTQLLLLEDHYNTWGNSVYSLMHLRHTLRDPTSEDYIPDTMILKWLEDRSKLDKRDKKKDGRSALSSSAMSRNQIHSGYSDDMTLHFSDEPVTPSEVIGFHAVGLSSTEGSSGPKGFMEFFDKPTSNTSLSTGKSLSDISAISKSLANPSASFRRSPSMNSLVSPNPPPLNLFPSFPIASPPQPTTIAHTASYHSPKPARSFMSMSSGTSGSLPNLFNAPVAPPPLLTAQKATTPPLPTVKSITPPPQIVKASTPPLMNKSASPPPSRDSNTPSVKSVITFPSSSALNPQQKMPSEPTEEPQIQKKSLFSKSTPVVSLTPPSSSGSSLSYPEHSISLIPSTSTSPSDSDSDSPSSLSESTLTSQSSPNSICSGVQKTLSRLPSGESTIATVNFSNAKGTKLLSPAGSAGSGATIRACTVDGFQCALKEYRFDKSPDHKLMAKFLREVEMIETLSHPNVVRHLFHTHTAHSLRLFLTRYETSLRIEVRNRGVESPFDEIDPFLPREILSLLRDIANGLSYLHERDIIHRDMKSDNIFLEFSDGDGDCGWRAVIGDFDTAKQLAEGVLAKTVVGTTNYI